MVLLSDESPIIVWDAEDTHGVIFPVVIEGDTVRAWAGHTIYECLGGGHTYSTH